MRERGTCYLLKSENWLWPSPQTKPMLRLSIVATKTTKANHKKIGPV